MSRPQTMPAGPLFRRFDVAAARDAGTIVRVEATDRECAALAAEFELPGIDALAADFRVVREGVDGLRVTGTVAARLRRICVVSLDEFASDLSEPVDVRFAPDVEVEALAEARAARAMAQDDEGDDDLPDPIIAGRIDLGALTAEILVLMLDPHPRKPGVAFADPIAASPREPEVSPFAALRGLKGAGEN